jgi:hypothetical protein
METYTATKIDHKYIYYKCNYCFKLRNKIIANPLTPNGYYYSGLKNGYHIYNSYGDFTDRVLDLKSNCFHSPNKSIQLIINEKTLRIK